MGIIRQINGRLVTATCWVLLSITRGSCRAPGTQQQASPPGAGNRQAEQCQMLPRGAMPRPWAARQAMAAPSAEPPSGTVRVGFFPQNLCTVRSLGRCCERGGCRGGGCRGGRLWWLPSLTLHLFNYLLRDRRSPISRTGQTGRTGQMERGGRGTHRGGAQDPLRGQGGQGAPWSQQSDAFWARGSGQPKSWGRNSQCIWARFSLHQDGFGGSVGRGGAGQPLSPQDLVPLPLAPAM